MSRDGAGSFNLISPANPFVDGLTIVTADVNNTLSDIASALTTSVSSDGQTPMTGTLNMNSNAISGVSGLDVTGLRAKGTILADTAATGTIGEYLSATGNLLAINTNTETNNATLALTAGDWEVWGNLYFRQLSGAYFQLVGWINTDGGAYVPGVGNGSNVELQTSFTANTDLVVQVGRCRISTAAPVTVYLNSQAQFTGPSGGASGAKAAGLLQARRMR